MCISVRCGLHRQVYTRTGAAMYSRTSTTTTTTTAVLGCTMCVVCVINDLPRPHASSDSVYFSSCVQTVHAFTGICKASTPGGYLRLSKFPKRLQQRTVDGVVLHYSLSCPLSTVFIEKLVGVLVQYVLLRAIRTTRATRSRTGSCGSRGEGDDYSCSLFFSSRRSVGMTRGHHISIL